MARKLGRPAALSSKARIQVKAARNSGVSVAWLAKFYRVSVATVARVR